MATFPTSGLTLGTLGIAFGDPAPYEMAYLAYKTSGYIPKGWQVSGKSAPPTTKGSYVDMNRFRGGGYEPSYTVTVTSAQGPDEAAGTFFTGAANVYGYSGLTGVVTYGSASNSTNDEGWQTIGVACIAEKTAYNKGILLLVTLKDNSEKLVNKVRNNPVSVGISGAGAGFSNTTYYSSSASFDNNATLGTHNIRQIGWYLSNMVSSTVNYNPFSGKTITAVVNRLSYEF